MAAVPTRVRHLVTLLAAVGRRFYDDQCLVRASALAYTSLLSLVPLFAVMFAVLKGLGVQERLESVMLSRLSLNPDTTDMIVGYIDRTNFGTLGALGAAALLFTVISVLGTIEASFNMIWRVAVPRTYWRKLTDYLGVVLLTPFLLLGAVAITSVGQLRSIVQWTLTNGYLGPAAVQALRLSPIVINAAALGILYAVMPNRRPAVGPIVVSALIAGALWHLVQLAYLALQVGVAGYNAIYGAVAQLPVTLVWLYVSWTIVLVGAELAAVLEFGPAYGVGPGDVRRDAIALHVLVRAADVFRSGTPGVETLAIARELRVDPGEVEGVLPRLEHLGWIAAAGNHGRAVVIARDPASIELGAISGMGAASAMPRGCDPRVRNWLAGIETAAETEWHRYRLADVLDAKDDKPES